MRRILKHSTRDWTKIITKVKTLWHHAKTQCKKSTVDLCTVFAQGVYFFVLFLKINLCKRKKILKTFGFGWVSLKVALWSRFDWGEKNSRKLERIKMPPPRNEKSRLFLLGNQYLNRHLLRRPRDKMTFRLPFTLVLLLETASALVLRQGPLKG